MVLLVEELDEEVCGVRVAGCVGVAIAEYEVGAAGAEGVDEVGAEAALGAGAAGCSGMAPVGEEERGVVEGEREAEGEGEWEASP